MEKVIDNVYRLEGLNIANVYLLASDGSLTLVDGGTRRDADRIVAEIESGGYDPSALQSIIVTHAHADHIGSVAALAQRFDADVIAHRAEAPYLEGTTSMPARGLVQGLMRVMEELLPDDEGIDVAIRLEDGETVDILGGLQVIHTPGHTPGSMCLYQPERQILFCGDLLFNGHPLTGRGGLRYAPKSFSTDPEALKRAIDTIVDLQVRALCLGHGAPILRDPSVRLGNLLREARA
jgi:glyoxylase-like metal-dependent hydrolase (beta-lactamase superfamily II)